MLCECSQGWDFQDPEVGGGGAERGSKLQTKLDLVSSTFSDVGGTAVHVAYGGSAIVRKNEIRRAGNNKNDPTDEIRRAVITVNNKEPVPQAKESTDAQRSLRLRPKKSQQPTKAEDRPRNACQRSEIQMFAQTANEHTTLYSRLSPSLTVDSATCVTRNEIRKT
eukprot:524275-Prorocentrum_minimum.AAC.1